MVRLFKHHNKRKNYTLEGMWSFRTDLNREGFKEQWFKNFPSDSRRIFVPSCWNTEFGLYDYEGLAWYETFFSIEYENINIRFHGVAEQAEVYLDGEYLGSHYGGFTSFNFTVGNLKPGEHKLVLAVDNTHNAIDTVPPAITDWYHYGGIIRDVEIFELKDVWIKDYRIHYEISEDMKSAKMGFCITLEGMRTGEIVRNINIYMNDCKIHSYNVIVEGITKNSFSGIKIDNIKLWDENDPNLYYIRIEIEDDDVTERIGFRKICVFNKKLFLNGKEVKLLGVNCSEDYPDWGFSIPAKLIKKDIDIIKDLGCNSIRASHHPKPEVFLDFCDEEGILVWEEIPLYGVGKTMLENPVVIQRSLKMCEEMVSTQYHHPCIIIWSMHNEIDTCSIAAFDLTKFLAERIRNIDNTRLLSYATNRPLNDICYSLADIASINSYPGWYDKKMEDWPNLLYAVKEKLASENLGHMPLIISEFGAAAIYGVDTFQGFKWSENYQEKYLEYTLKLFISDADISGMYIWQYSDILTTKGNEMKRPRSYNNKGIVNEYRQPKLAYRKVREIFQSQKYKSDDSAK